MLGLPVAYGIVFFGLVTGAYTIYGGLKSAAWTDFMQILVLGAGGVLVPILGLHQVGGLSHLMREHPEKFQVFLPVTHERFPVTGVFTGFLTVGCGTPAPRSTSSSACWRPRTNTTPGWAWSAPGSCTSSLRFSSRCPASIAFALHPSLPRGDAAPT